MLEQCTEPSKIKLKTTTDWMTVSTEFDLLVFIRPRRSKSVETVIQSVVVFSLLFNSSVHCPSIRDYAFWMFSLGIESLLTYASTFFVNIILSTSSFVPDGANGMGIANLTFCSMVDLMSPPMR